VQFAFLGRKKAAGGGWNCAGCVTDVVGEVRGLTGAQKTTDAITGL